jgi:hypothetical protein
MNALVIYESMYGNTHLIADAIAGGLRTSVETTVVPVSAVDAVDAELLAHVDLVVVGGPTHVHGMSRASTRTAAVAAAGKPGSGLALDVGAERPERGLRDWFASSFPLNTRAAAFDTRVDRPVAFTGRASKGIARELRRHGAFAMCEPCSFFVTNDNRLVNGEEDRAHEWGARLCAALSAPQSH